MALRTSGLELVKLSKRYGKVTAVDAIDLVIAPGSYCCLLGPSGCGKTSTLRMIAGHGLASDGDIRLADRNITHLPAAARGTAMMFQSHALFPHLTVLDNVAFSLKMKGVAKPARHARASPPRTGGDGPLCAAAAGRAFGLSSEPLDWLLYSPFAVALAFVHLIPCS